MACPSTQVYHEEGAYLGEIWAWFIVGTIVLFVRTAIRLRTVGWRQLQGDDYMAVAVWLCFICDSVTVTIIYKYGSNLDFTEEDLQRRSHCELHKIRIGSQMQLLAWYTYTLLIWSLKAMMLFFFNRLTFGLTQQRFVKIFAVICGATYLAVFLTISCGCFPIQRNWQVLPQPPKQCTMKLQNFYVTTVLNVVTDAMVLSIPVPLLWGIKIPWTRKIGLMLLLGSGIFVITAAIMRITFTFADVNALNINRWGTRETIAGIIAVNAPILTPLFKKNFWKRGWPSSHRISGSPMDRSPNPHRTIGSAEDKKKVNQYEMFDLQLQSLFDEGHDQKDSTTTSVRKTEIDSKISSSRTSDDISPIRKPSTQVRPEEWDVELGYPLSNIRVDTTFEISSETTSPAITQPPPAVVRSHSSRPEDLCLLPSISEGSYTNTEAARRASMT